MEPFYLLQLFSKEWAPWEVGASLPNSMEIGKEPHPGARTPGFQTLLSWQVTTMLPLPCTSDPSLKGGGLAPSTLRSLMLIFQV